eukprot:8186259-Lingulodinium_polyedra.AAC.1
MRAWPPALGQAAIRSRFWQRPSRPRSVMVGHPGAQCGRAAGLGARREAATVCSGAPLLGLR